jgi:hypothetical protein
MLNIEQNRPRVQSILNKRRFLGLHFTDKRGRRRNTPDKPREHLAVSSVVFHAIHVRGGVRHIRAELRGDTDDRETWEC